jgi:LysR family hydrogen peroxide-inducible transcriptional activator
MMNLPSLRQLQYLIALHKHQHFSKAAKACHISQSTLSAAIQQLEDVMECQLLERSHKSFIFTALGEQVVLDAKLLIQSGTDLLQYTRSHNKPMSGQLVLGCIPTIAPFVLSSIAKNTTSQYPDLQLMLREDTSDNLLASLGEGEVDMVILALPYKTDGFCEAILAEDAFNLVMHKQTAQENPSNDIKRLPAQSLFLLRQEHCLTEHTKSICKVSDKNRINPFLATSLQTLVQMVDSQYGATYLPQMAINSNILRGTNLVVRKTEPAGAHRKIGLLWRQSNKRVATFVNLAMIISEVVRGKCIKNKVF